MKALIALAVIFVSLFSVGNLLADDDVVADQPAREIVLILRDKVYSGDEVSGAAWYIFEDGRYEVHDISSSSPVSLIRSGNLSEQQLDDLKNYLTYRGLNSMPKNIGMKLVHGSDAELLSLRWNDNGDYKTVFLNLLQGKTLEGTELEYAKSDSYDAVYVDRFASIVKTIKGLCSE